MEELENKESENKEEENKEEENYPKKRMDFRFELALFFILGFLLGVVIKTEASKRVTIGFNDNEIISVKQAYDFEKIKKEIAEKKADSQQVPAESQGETQEVNQ